MWKKCAEKNQPIILAELMSEYLEVKADFKLLPVMTLFALPHQSKNLIKH